MVSPPSTTLMSWCVCSALIIVLKPEVVLMSATVRSPTTSMPPPPVFSPSSTPWWRILQLGRGGVEVEVEHLRVAAEVRGDVVGGGLSLVEADLVLAGHDLHGARRGDDALRADALVDGPLEHQAVGVRVQRLHGHRPDALAARNAFIWSTCLPGSFPDVAVT